MSTDTLNRPEVELSTTSPSSANTSEPFFSRQEIRQFDSDDAEAGRRIGKNSDIIVYLHAHRNERRHLVDASHRRALIAESEQTPDTSPNR